MSNHRSYISILLLTIDMLRLYSTSSVIQCTPSQEQTSTVYESFKQACKLLENHQLEQAIRTFKEVQKKNPSVSQAYYNCGIAYHLLNDLDSALTQFQKACEQNPLYVKAYVQAGLLCAKRTKSSKL